jgi:hypothetical protein
MRDSDDRHSNSKYWLPLDGKTGKRDVLTQARKVRGDVDTEASDRGGAQYRTFSDPLDFYWRRRLISGLERRAGNNLARIHGQAALNGRYVHMRYGEAPGKDDAHDSALLGIELSNALVAIHGEKERKLAYLVCCEGWMAGRGNIVRLQNALQDLARHFGMTEESLR